MQIQVRVGLANPNGRMPAEMEARGVPVLVSANSLFDHKKGKFRPVPQNLADIDVALDSAGFVAMKRYGRYPWSIAQYVEMALISGFTWWSQMDCCVEPEVAGDRDTVIGRIHATSQMLRMCREETKRWLIECPEFRQFATMPMPIIQGWQPEDYRLSIDLANEVLGGEWPEMIGVGSVCRRRLDGPAGLWAVLNELDRTLPAHVKLHLFGVKGSALRRLANHSRVVSVDSMAFEMRARVKARELGVKKTVDFRVATMDLWLARQIGEADLVPSVQQAFAFA